MRIDNVMLFTTANIYFDGKVVSYTFWTADKQRHTVGIIFPGVYEFSTSCREKMQITTGFMHVEIPRVDVDGVGAGDEFEVSANTTFKVICDVPTEYICTYLE